MAAQPTGVTDGHNLWDFLIVLVVILALVGVTIFLVLNYLHSPKTTISILGILVPALAGVFGITLGAAAGQLKGKATGQHQARQQMKQSLESKLNDVTQAVETSLGTFSSDEGREGIGDTRGLAPAQNEARLRESVASLRGYVEGLG